VKLVVGSVVGDGDGGCLARWRRRRRGKARVGGR